MARPNGSSPILRRFEIPAPFVPGIVFLILALPCFGFPFLWDDFDFLGRAARMQIGDLLPDPNTIYYRPLSREIYFGIVTLLGPSPFIGHLLNAAIVLGVIALLYLVARYVAGRRAGLMSALLFSGLGPLPLLVGWVSGVQDALAMLFVIGAVLAELRGRRFLGPVLLVCGLLSKETAAAAIPAIVMAASIRSPGRRSIVRRAAAYGLLAVVWLAVHPAVRAASSAGGGDEIGPSLGGARFVISGFLAALNLPLGEGAVAGLRPLAAAGLIAVIAALASCVWLDRGRPEPPAEPPASEAQVLLLGLLMTVPALLLTALLPRVWSPYYACFPALGISIIGGSYLAKASPRVAGVVLAAYLLLGIWTRTVGLEPEVTTESNLRRTGAALDQMERGFKVLRESFPSGSHIYVSAQLGGPTGVYRHLYRNQPHRVWYREPSLFVLDPNRYRPGARNEFLFWVDKNFDVFEIDLTTLQPRASRPGAQPTAFAYGKTLRTFALGRAAGGQVAQAVRILLTIPGRPLEVQIYDRRSAAALLLATGHEREAEAVLAGVPQFPRSSSLEAVFAVLAEPVPGLALDDAAMRAFGLSPSDLEANRMLMDAFDHAQYGDSAKRFAMRVLALAPGDAHARDVLAKWSRRGPAQVTVPIPHD